MPTLSVLTPVVHGKHHYLGQTYESLVRQELPPGWDWQWIVQEDGDTGFLRGVLPSDPRISAGASQQGRAAMARTMGLARAEGELIRALDADDVLPDGALEQEIKALASSPEYAWSVSPTLDLMPDGSLVPGPRDPEPGPLPPGALYEGQAAGSLQVVGTTLCTYTALVRALGGWQALYSDEDVALLLAVEAVAPGIMLPEPGLHYRKWSGATTAQADDYQPADGAMRNAAILSRADALRESGWRWPTAGEARI
ncbi:Glycosyl transferase family 2 [Saccharopolyspora antimicrobica]|uniref:Glycosyl transferase family 2 n=1 Tax=Saccharopolyspora antimicrobica TaxID=455193 RepID=A0A1I5ITJ5_9PSEU|nr:glycosyltransferase [Saccharopolyspora antimicrobica]RKT84157.1 glycosyl transferase family 2 [Saccharopolyspora antimicrobica]SFO63481.1 Glycosyl transferase family 2 [Saccharopolyspora antimicrobica]